MPRVPTYDNLQVLPSPIPRTSVEIPDVAGAQASRMGEAITGAGRAATRIAVEAAEDANRVRVVDALNQAVGERQRLTWDPEAGFTHLRGLAALERPGGKALADEYDEAFDKTIRDISSNLGNDAQRRAFAQGAARLRTEFRSQLAAHEGREFAVYRTSVEDGGIAIATNEISQAWAEPERIETARNTIKALVVAQGQRTGLSPLAIEARMREVLSPAHASVIAQAVDTGQLDYARAYLEQHDNELTAPAKLQATRLLDEGTVEMRAQASTDELWAKHQGDIGAALAEARATLSGKQEDAVVTRLKVRDAELMARREQLSRAVTDRAWDFYARGGIEAVPPSVLAMMDGRDLVALRKTAQADAEARATGSTVKTDPSVYYALSLAAAEDPEFATADLRAFFDKLSPTDRKHFIDMQAKVASERDGPEVVTTQQQLSATVKLLELDDVQAGLFLDQANRALDAAQAQKGKKLTQDERQKVIDYLVQPGGVKTADIGWFQAPWNKRPVYERGRRFESMSENTEFTPAWTDAQRREAVAALRRRGVKEPTDDQVTAVLYAAHEVLPAQRMGRPIRLPELPSVDRPGVTEPTAPASPGPVSADWNRPETWNDIPTVD